MKLQIADEPATASEQRRGTNDEEGGEETGDEQDHEEQDIQDDYFMSVCLLDLSMD